MLLLLALACRPASSTEEVADTGVLDLRQDYPKAEGKSVQIRSPDLLVPAYSEKLFCYYGTWNGGDQAVNLLRTYQAAPYSHHNQLKLVEEDEAPPDGTLAECDMEEAMTYRPFIDGVPPMDIEGGHPSLPDEVTNMLRLPEGYAVKLEAGRHWVLDTHYVNTTGRDILVNSAVNIGFAEMDEVEKWVGVMQLDAGGLAIPPGDYSRSFDCSWPTELEVLVLSSHMHERGTAYAVDRVSGEEVQRVHEVPGWSDAYRAYAKMDVFEPGELVLAPHDALRTTCSWHNETEETLGFPEEMCTTLAMVAPLDQPHLCDSGAWR
jgi:hypothetical protein